MSFELTSKDSFPKFNFTPALMSEESFQRKKSDSGHIQTSIRDGVSQRSEDQGQRNSSDKAIDELRSQILSLTKKVYLNEEEIAKMREKEKKDKRLSTLEQQFTQFQIQMFDICKKNTNYFSDFEEKIDKNTKLIS